MGEQLNGTLISGFRKKTKISYEALASLVGVCPTVIRSMEKGYIPRARRDEVLTKLAEVIGVSATALVVTIKVA